MLFAGNAVYIQPFLSASPSVLSISYETDINLKLILAMAGILFIIYFETLVDAVCNAMVFLASCS